MTQRLRSGVVDQVVYFRMPSPGLSGFAVWYTRNGGNAVQMTTPAISQPSAANMPTVYALLADEVDLVTMSGGNICEQVLVQVSLAGQPTQFIELELYVDDLSHVLGSAIAEGGVAPGGGPIGY
jgi:hypothetical protein